jgi:hypothetical protein
MQNMQLCRSAQEFEEALANSPVPLVRDRAEAVKNRFNPAAPQT